MPRLKGGILVYAFEGWSDAGEAASTAIGATIRALGAEPVGELDPEPFYDFTETRPDVSIAGGIRHISWPTTSISIYRAFDGNEFVFVEGPEPQLRWQEFASNIAEVAAELKTTSAISLGALVADVAHSRPTPVRSSSSTPELRRLYRLDAPVYEGPTGILTVLDAALAEHDIPTAALWASIPSYVPHATSPKAALALLEKVEDLADLRIDPDDLHEAAEAYEAQIDSLVSDDDETLAYVAELEQLYDQSVRTDSGRALVAEVEQFLREQD